MNKFFIVGCPRSGTTMVQQALNRHPQVVIPPETKYFFSFYGHSHERQLRHITRLDADLGIHLPRPATRIASPSAGRAFYDLMARQYLERLGKTDITYFGEKTPEHSGHLPRIRQLFPEAKILVLYRDGRDVASSLRRMPWMSSDLYVNFMVWLYYCSVLRKETAEPSPNVYHARYEDIVNDPEHEFGSILNFLGLPNEPAVAHGFGNREGIPEREYGWKERALEKITRQRVGVFCDELSQQELETLERLGRHMLTAHGYPLFTNGERPLSARFLLKLSFNLSRFVSQLPWDLVARELLSRLTPGQPAVAPDSGIFPALT